MHSVYGLSLARHVHGVVGHVHWGSHCGIVLSYGLEIGWPAFIGVEYIVCLIDWSVCAIWCTTL